MMPLLNRQVARSRPTVLRSQLRRRDDPKFRFFASAAFRRLTKERRNHRSSQKQSLKADSGRTGSRKILKPRWLLSDLIAAD